MSTPLDQTAQAIIAAATNVNNAARNSSAAMSSAESQALETLESLVTSNSGGKTVVNTSAVQEISTMSSAQQATVQQAIGTLQGALATSSIAALTPAQQAVIAAAATQGITGLQFDPSAAAAAAAAPPPTTNTTPAPSSSSNTLSLLGAVSSLGPLLGKFFSGAAGSVLTTSLSVLGVGLNAWSVFSSGLSMFKNGFSGSKFGSLLMAAVGIEVAIAMPAILGGASIMFALTAAFPGTLIIVGLALLAAWIYSMVDKQNTAEQNMGKFNKLTVWSSNQVLSLASAAAFMAMGYNIDQAVTNLSDPGVMIPTSTLTQILAHNLTNADGSAYTGGLPYGVPIVLGGAGPNGGDEVVIISQAGIKNGVAWDTEKTYNLANNMAFTKPTDTSLQGAYIPFFGADGNVNPVAVAAENNQKALLTSTPNLAAASQTNGVAVAGASDKQGIQAVSYP